MNKNIVLPLGALLLLIIFYVLLSGKEVTDSSNLVSQTDYTAAGEVICLPHFEPGEVQTLECAIGLQGDDGHNYGLNTSMLDAPIGLEIFSVGSKVEVNGELTARADLESADRMLNYDIAGVVTVESYETLSDSTTDEETAMHTMAGGEVSFIVPTTFGLATNPDQVLVESSIPVCADGFDYCIYYNDAEYSGTNFNGAAVSLSARADLDSEQCLTTPPAGYNNIVAETNEGDGYQTATFAGIGNAGAGHYTNGTIYRLATESNCYEIETRIAEVQFANYPEGEIIEFSESDREVVKEMLDQIVSDVRLADSPQTPLF